MVDYAIDDQNRLCAIDTETRDNQAGPLTFSTYIPPASDLGFCPGAMTEAISQTPVKCLNNGRHLVLGQLRIDWH